MSLTVSKQTAYAVVLNPVMAVAKQTAYVVLLVAPTTEQGSISFTGELSLTLTPDSLTEFGSLEFRGNLSLFLTGQESPRFHCPTPTPKTWARPTIEAKTWACATVVPAEECDGIEVGASDDLDIISGDRLVTLDGYGLKLVS